MTQTNIQTLNYAIQSSAAMEQLRQQLEAYQKECPNCHKAGMIFVTQHTLAILECPQCGATVSN